MFTTIIPSVTLSKSCWLVFLLTCLLLSGCQTTPVPSTSVDVVGEISPGSGFVNGYLERGQLPDSKALLPQPPTAGSPEAAADLATHLSTRKLRGSPRWHQAAADNWLIFPAAADPFSCALGLTINAEETPHLTMLMRRSLLDAALATFGAKTYYQRQRPFIAFNESTCVPDEEARLSKDGSYPSGHAALGWAWALILTGLAPERADALLKRGFDFGQSRMICGVHWQSDVDNGRIIGAAVVARLQSDPVFKAQSEFAQQEIVKSRNSPQSLPPTCNQP